MGPETADYDAIFDQYRRYAKEAGALALGPGVSGVYFASRGPGQIGYMVGVEARPGATVPAGVVALDIAPARYAVFEFPRAEIGKAWHSIHGEWLPGSKEYALASSPASEFYPNGNTDETHLAIWIPLRARQ